MHINVVMLFILALVLSNIKLVSAFVTCYNAYNYTKGTSCYYVKTEDRSQFHYKKVNSDTCQKLCDKDARCTQYFHKMIRHCYLSHYNNNDKLHVDIYQSRRHCLWTRYAKG